MKTASLHLTMLFFVGMMAGFPIAILSSPSAILATGFGAIVIQVVEYLTAADDKMARLIELSAAYAQITRLRTCLKAANKQVRAVRIAHKDALSQKAMEHKREKKQDKAVHGAQVIRLQGCFYWANKQLQALRNTYLKALGQQWAEIEGQKAQIIAAHDAQKSQIQASLRAKLSSMSRIANLFTTSTQPLPI